VPFSALHTFTLSSLAPQQIKIRLAHSVFVARGICCPGGKQIPRSANQFEQDETLLAAERGMTVL
jgi:hypothetical protein